MANPTPPKAGRPVFKEPPRYKLLEKAFLAGVKVQKGKDWIPFDDVLLSPEDQPLAHALPGAFGGRGDPERVPLIIEYLGVPDQHMEPLNEAAEWMMEHIDELKEQLRAERVRSQKGVRTRNPVDALTIIGSDATVLRQVEESV